MQKKGKQKFLAAKLVEFYGRVWTGVYGFRENVDTVVAIYIFKSRRLL